MVPASFATPLPLAFRSSTWHSEVVILLLLIVIILIISNNTNKWPTPKVLQHTCGLFATMLTIAVVKHDMHVCVLPPEVSDSGLLQLLYLFIPPKKHQPPTPTHTVSCLYFSTTLYQWMCCSQTEVTEKLFFKKLHCAFFLGWYHFKAFICPQLPVEGTSSLAWKAVIKVFKQHKDFIQSGIIFETN